MSELRDDHPNSRSVKLWARKVKVLHAEAKAFESKDVRVRVRARQDFEQRELKLTLRYAEDESAPQRTLGRRMSRHVNELFVFVGFPYVPSGSNISERALRALVVARKMN